MKKPIDSRRDFIKKAVVGATALSFGGTLPSFSAKSYANIVGANERIRVAIMGVNARGLALASNFSSQSNCEVAYICDVDSRATEKCSGMVEKSQDKRPKPESDIRKLLSYA